MNYSFASSVLGFLAVALGAFGAHALKDTLGSYEKVWQTAVFYQLTHSILLFVISRHGPKFILASRLLFFGILVFSFSLYALCLTGVTKLGLVTPIGGLLLLASWLVLAKQTWQEKI